MEHKKVEYKLIKIKELPDCYSKELLLKMVENPNVADVYVVAKPGHINDWACYIGFPAFEQLNSEYKFRGEMTYYCYNVRNWDEVMANGDKLSKETAEILFPEFKHLQYRG